MITLLHIGIPAIGTLITAHILVGIWGRRYIDSYLLFFRLLILTIFIWSAGSLAEILAPTLAAKIGWVQVQYLGTSFLALLWFAFISSYLGSARWLTPLTMGLLSIVPTITLLFTWTNSYHHLIWADYWLVEPLGFPLIDFDYGPAFLVNAGYSYILILLGTLILLRALYNSPHNNIRRKALLAAAGLSPWLGNLLYITGINQSLLDLIILGFTLSGLLLFWILVRHHFSDIRTVAHQLINYSLPDPVLVFDTKDRLIDLNPAAQQIFFPFTQQSFGQYLDQIFEDYPEILEKLQQANLKNTSLTTSYLHGDTYYNISTKSIYIKQQEKIGRVLILRDISEHVHYQAAIKIHNEKLKTLNKQLEEALQQAESAKQAKDRFLATTTHDLRTPITNIMLYLSLLEKRPEKATDYIETIRHEAARMKHQVEDLLDIARLEQDNTKLNTVPLDLNAIIMEYVQDRKATLERQQLTLHTALEQDLPQLDADPMLLGRVIGNLLGNATNYTPAGGSILMQTITQTYDDMPGVIMNICDTGPGIPVEERTKVFEHFYRGNNQATNTEGTGLGLAISQEIIRRHHGWIRVEDGPQGYRTQFSVWLPTKDMPVNAQAT